MSLATRCTACHTVFRVVQDQLKVSEGWVRCGRCHEVFNALEGLFDLPPAATPAAAPPAVVAPAPPPALAADAVVEAAPPGEEENEPAAMASVAEAPAGDDENDTPAPWAAAAEDDDITPASRVAARDRLDFADAQFNQELLAEAGMELPPPEDAPADVAPAVEAAPPTPEFVRRAERQAQWDRPRTVAGLALASLLLAAALVLQAALHWRDTLAVSAPALRPALQVLCDVAGCRIEPLRRIDDIVIESSALTAAAQGDAVRLSVVLRNRGRLPLAMPYIELTLADTTGKLLVRRALSPADFAAAHDSLAPGAESPLQLVLSTGGRTASGYTVEPFYP